MYRRRRHRPTEIAFSFDSFLDLVANVVGIIMKLILVAWVGARSYTGYFAPPAPPPAATSEEPESAPVPVALSAPEVKLTTDAEKAALGQARKQLADARAALLEHLRRQDELAARKQDLDRSRAALSARSEDAERRREEIDAALRKVEGEREKIELSLEDIRRRGEKLREELAALEKRAPAKNVLHYQTPVARTVQSEELHFECKNGRVTLLDVEAMLRDIRQGMRARAEELKSRWQFEDETPPAGAFRLRYVVARERELIDNVLGPATPSEFANFRYGVTGWEAVPVQAVRGETFERALTAESEFRRIIDHLDATQTAVTFWVYPDSFPLYRQIRDYCVRRDLLVAGRPLPEGVPIASSREGTRSRGQ